MYTFIYTLGGRLELSLYKCSQLNAVLHVLVLEEFEDDIALRRIRIKSGVTLLIVVFNLDYGIFFFGYFQVVVSTM